jgi:mannose-6-phosphate isomerase-like protein (cupin superfamily)
MATMEQIPPLDRTQPTRPLQPPQPPSSRFDGSTGPRIIGPRDGKFVDLRSVGVRFMIWGAESGGGFSLVEHPIPPRTLVAPLHLHEREDEYSYVLEGRMGAQLGDDVVFAEPGDLVFKPRNQWHTFWNAGDTPCRILEIISPAGFEHFFNELGDGIAAAHAPSVAAVPDVSGLAARYGHYFRPESVERLCREHGLVYPA